MRVFGLGRQRRGTLRTGTNSDLRHLQEFIATRAGVEAYVEPRTAVTDTTILLVAEDGEWKRRRVQGPSGAADFARRAAIPIYDAAIVGYPQRMRDFNARRRNEG